MAKIFTFTVTPANVQAGEHRYGWSKDVHNPGPAVLSDVFAAGIAEFVAAGGSGEMTFTVNVEKAA